MLRRLSFAAVGFFAVLAAVVWWRVGAINAPVLPPPAGERETLLRERIKVPEGWSFSVFASDLGRPRLMQLTASGDVIVSGYRRGALLLLRADGDGDGRSDGTVVLREGLRNPHGLLLEGNRLLVAEEHRVVAFDFDGASLGNENLVLGGLPDDGGHSSRTLKRGPDGFLYLSIGSSCNACIETHPWRAAMLRFREGEAPEVFARGLRNTVGFDWQPGTGLLFGVDNGRDNLGDDIPDDEVNLIEHGKHYGWPYVHGAGVPDPALFGEKPAGLRTIDQFHGLGGHVAPLSIRFLRSAPGAALVAEHGSWNRTEKAGYRIIRLVLDGETVREEVFLAGCEAAGEVICRPVDVLELPDGGLLVTDDYAGSVYRVSKALTIKAK